MERGFLSNSDIFPCIQTCGDQRFTPDVLDSIYASSPNSLFMYDQEKMDMQCSTLSDTQSVVCPGTNSLPQLSDDFELKSQYEISQDLSVSSQTVGEVSHPASTPLIADSGGGEVWGDTTKVNSGMMINKGKSEDSPDPTLAELNLTSSNLDLLEDIDTYINTDMCSFYLDSRTDQSFGKEEPVYTKMTNYEMPAQYVQNYVTDLASKTKQATATSAGQFSTPLAIKTEPRVYETSCQKTYTTLSSKTTSTTSVESSLHVLSQLYSQRKQQSEDKSALQKLLHTTSHQIPVSSVHVKTEEPLKSPCEKRVRNPSGGRVRKRSGAQAGLESMDAKWEEIKQFIYNPLETDTQQNFPTQIKRERKRYGK